MGKGAEEVVVGFRYHMGVQIVGCHGPVDSVNRIIVGEREAWAGNVTTSSTININKPDLFGGDDREGGVVGDVDVMMGEPTQGRNAYLASQQGPKCSAYRGLLSLVFKQFLWSSGNPYFKSPWVEATRALKGWENDTPWHPELALIGGKDMNPAHIIYQCFTDSAWGMGYNATDIDDVDWLVAAQKLYDEGFGISLEWDQQSDIESFVQQILNHINGSVGVNLANGKIRLKLVRDDYDMGTLLELNADNVIELKSFQRAAYGDSANELVISYTDRDQNTATIAVQDLASIQAQGAVISSTQQYPGIRDASLATRIGMRDLRVLSSPLAKVVLVTNRVMWDKDKGDVVKLVWPSLGIVGVAFRVIDIDKGTLSNGSINVTLIEDIFGLPANSYASTPVSQWVDTLVAPIAVSSSKAVEASHWDITRAMRLADQQQLVEGYGFGMFMASRGAVRSTLNYRLTASPDNVQYTDVGTGHFNPTGTLVASLTPIAETLTLTGAYDLDNATLSVDGGYAYIDDECVAVTAVNPSTGVISVKRGVLDTVPSAHIAGTRMFFVSGSTGYDRTERVSGETVYYKPLPSTGLGTLASNDAIAKMLVLNNRASRPYPPGNLRIDANLYPVTVPGPTFTVSWSHRDRAAQTVDFVDYAAGNIGPEIGTTYRLRVYSGATLLRTYDLSGDVTSWSYPSADDLADGNLATLTITVNSVRDGLESLYSQGHTFQRLTVMGSTGIEGKPATPTLSASAQPFAIGIDWILGDARTNVEKVEIRVSDDPDFNHSTVLQYVNYPTLTFLHEVGTALTFKWYWARVHDVSGQLSAWSNMVSARSSSSAVTPQAILDAIQGALDETALDATLRARIDLIDTPLTGLVDQAADLASAITSEANARADAESAIADQITVVSAVANAKNRTYSQVSAPVVGLIAGDLWFDTDSNNKPYRYSGSAWVATEDTRIAANAAAITTEANARADADSATATQISQLTAVVDGKTGTFKQSVEPVATAIGDLWVDTGSENLLVWSEDFTNEAWLKAGGATASLTQLSDPSNTTYGTVTSPIVSGVSGEPFVASFVVEKDTIASSTRFPTLRLAAVGITSHFVELRFDTSNLATFTSLNGANSVLDAAGVIDHGDHFTAWVSGHFNNASVTGVRSQVYPSVGASPTLTSFSVTTTGSIGVRGAAIERGTAPGRYIPTTTAPVSTVGNNKTYRWNGTEWEGTEDARFAILQTEASVHATTLGELSAQYTVKIDINGHVTGYGLASTEVDGVPLSEFAIVADRFRIGAPDGTKTPFAVVDIGGGVWKTMLNSDVLIGGNVDIANLKTGSLPNDVMLRLGGGTIELDGAGEIRVFKDLAPNADFVRLSSGEIRFMRYMAGAYQTYNYLSRLETGIANSGATVVIPGYWKAQPRVMVSPASLALYKAAYAAQDQGITALANALVETSPGSGRWQFSPTATLNLSASSGVTPVNEASGSLSANTWASATKVTAANCSSVTPSVNFSSSRGNGSSQYFRRSVRWRVEHWNGSAWVAGAYRTVAMGDQFGTVADSVAYAFPSAGTWSWRIYAEAFDTDGSIFGSITYTTSTETITGQTGTMTPVGGVVTITRPASTLNPTWEVYKLDINLAGSMNNPYTQYNYNTMVINWNRPTGAPAVTNAGMTVSGWSDQIITNSPPNYSNNPFNRSAVFTKITTALVPNTTVGTANVDGDGLWTPDWTCVITTNTMVVYRRTPNTNSTTPANTFNVASYGWSLASAQVLATGSINWIAVGE